MQEEQDYDDFRVGDTVYCAMAGEGKVVNIISGGAYPIKVEFTSGRLYWYTLAGALDKGSPRLLFFTPPAPGATKRPFVSNLIGRTIFFNYQGSYIRGKVESEDGLTIRVSYYSHLEHKISKRFDNDWYIAEEKE